MNRNIKQWSDCSPKAMACDMSQAAQLHAFADARDDILELHKLNERLKDLLRQIAYPKRGTEEEQMDIFDASKLIQSNFSLEQLE